MSKRIITSFRDFPPHRQDKIIFYRDNDYGKEYKAPTKSSRIRFYRALDSMFINNGNVKIFPLREYEYQILYNNASFTIYGMNSVLFAWQNLRVEKLDADTYKFSIGGYRMIKTSDVELTRDQVKDFRDALTHLIGE